MDMLTRDETWINRPDMLSRFDLFPEALPDAEVRAQVNNYFRHSWEHHPPQRSLDRPG